MKSLIQEQEKAREYRSQGKSIREISQIINRPQSSISYWVRTVKLTEEQKLILEQRNPVRSKESRLRASQGCVKTWRERRIIFQEQGKLLVREKNPDFIAGIMLYWAEGSKNKNQIDFSNTDINMMIFFVKFIFKFFNIKEEDISLKIHCHLNNNLTLDQIQKFWTSQLNLYGANFNKTIIEQGRKISGKRKNIHKYGVCHIRINRTDIVQKIFGAIQEYIGFENTKWLK